MARLQDIFVYPLKSAAALPRASARVAPRGLDDDRRWLVVDAGGQFQTGRQLPALVRIKATPVDGGLHLAWPGQPDLQLASPGPEAARMQVRVWKDQVDAALAGAEADAWLTRALGRPLRLVHMDAASHRPVDPDYGRAGDQVSFADGYPLLAISQAALDQLNERLPRPLPMLRFRPNLVLAEVPAHAEDGWRRLRIGAVEFAAVKPCTRCVFTTIDHRTGVADPDGEPLQTLKGYRRGERGITFGMNLIPRGDGVVATGDAITVLA
jgi:uncharacterized protein YcbX